MLKQNFLLAGLGIFLIVWILSVGFPNAAQAAGLVPCSGPDCNYCSFLQLVKNIIDFLLYLIFPVATLMVVVGGFFVLTTGGAPERAKRGRSIITAAIVGLVIALLAWLIIDTIIKVIAPNFQGASGLAPWNQLNCNPPGK